MKLQISEIAKLTGVSVRTLHYYDEIGLLKPAETDEYTGYRFYDEASIEKLKQILYYREMDFSLKEISMLLVEREVHKNSKLLERRKLLMDKKKQLELLIETIEEDLSKPVEIAGWFDKILKDYHYSGFSYEGAKKEFFCTWGKADYEKDKLFALNSRFPIGSLVQIFVGFCGLLMEEQGVLPMAALEGCWCEQPESASESEQQVPGSGEANHCEALCALMEQVSGKALEELLKEYIFTPLEMWDTSFEGAADVIGYEQDMPIPTQPSEGEWKSILTTAEDMGKWCQALLDRRLLSKEGYEKLLTPRVSGWTFGWYQNGHLYSHETQWGRVYSQLQINFQNGTYYIAVRNKAPLPSPGERHMYFVINGCDDGLVKLEAWEMDTDTCVKVHSMKLYDKDVTELHTFPAGENGYHLWVENHGEKRLASEFVEEDGYFLQLDLKKILGEQFDREAAYILEVKAECDGLPASQLGIKYQHEGKEEYMGYYIFYHYEQAYELFMEALGNVTEAGL